MVLKRSTTRQCQRRSWFSQPTGPLDFVRFSCYREINAAILLHVHSNQLKSWFTLFYCCNLTLLFLKNWPIIKQSIIWEKADLCEWALDPDLASAVLVLINWFLLGNLNRREGHVFTTFQGSSVRLPNTTGHPLSLVPYKVWLKGSTSLKCPEAYLCDHTLNSHFTMTRF